MSRAARLLSSIERAVVWIGNAVLMVLMLLVTLDVFLRYFLSMPLTWTHDVVSLYLMPAVFFLLLSDSFREGAQVRVDILRDRLPARVRTFADAAGHLAVLAVIALIGLGAWGQLVEAWQAQEVVAGSIPWPLWPSFLLATLGSAMLALRLAAACAAGAGPGRGAGEGKEAPEFGGATQ